MADFSRDRFREADALFDAALDLSPDEHGAFLDRACPDDWALRAEVRRLLTAHMHSREFLETPAIEIAGPLMREAWESGLVVAPPEHVGPFRIVREIGHGGMGTVFLAERDDGQFSQRVAIKLVLRPGRSDSLVPRFLEERRILARLEHPNIARLVDGGITLDGTPWFAMEYVDGVAIDRWCDAHGLPIERRLDLFMAACEAVQYAHQQLVVHRDLKPSNILVAADGQLRLLDFGIAKFLSADPEETGELTVSSTTLRAMTPQYAAPEQVRGEPVSAATDVYALGVLLHELLTGRRPYDVRGKSPVEIERIVCEVEPARPSTLFEATADLSRDDCIRRARARDTTPERLRRTLRGDLDAVILQALRKDPSRRYPTVIALLNDLRFLRAGRPVHARPDSATYRLRRFVRRHRAILGSTALFMVLLGAGFARERALRQRAEQESRKAREVGDFIVSVFDVADPFSARPGTASDVTARELLDRGVTRVDRDLAGQPEVQAELRGVFGRVYRNLGDFAKAEQQARAALAQRRALYGTRHPAVADAMYRLGQVLAITERYDEAETMLRDALAQRRAFLGNDSREAIESLEQIGTLAQDRGRLDDAERIFREALALRLRAPVPQRDSLGVATSLNNIALVLFIKGKFDDSEPLYREALPILERTLGPDHPQTAMTVQNLAQVQQLRGQLDDAEMLFRRALAIKRRVLGDQHPSVTIGLNNLGNFLARDRGKLEESEVLVREAIALDRKMFGDRHGFVAAGLNNLSSIKRLRGEFADALGLSREAVSIGKAALPDPSKDLAVYINGAASAQYAMGDLAGAEATYREALALYRRALGESHLFTQTVAVNLGRTLRERGTLDEAMSLFRGATAVLDSTRSSDRQLFIAARVGQGQVRAARGELSAAITELTEAAAASRKQSGDAHWRTADANLALATALAQRGEWARAEPLLRAAIQALEPQARSQPRLLAEAQRVLAMVLRTRATAERQASARQATRE